MRGKTGAWVLVGCLLAGCGGGDDPAPIDAAPMIDADPNQGRLTIVGTNIAGAQNKIVLAGIPGSGGGGFQGSICEQITTDPASFAAVAKAALSMNPCDLGADVVFPNGTYDLTAGIYTPGSMSAELCITTTVTITSDTMFTLPAFGTCN